MAQKNKKKKKPPKKYNTTHIKKRLGKCELIVIFVQSNRRLNGWAGNAKQQLHSIFECHTFRSLTKIERKWYKINKTKVHATCFDLKNRNEKRQKKTKTRPLERVYFSLNIIWLKCSGIRSFDYILSRRICARLNLPFEMSTDGFCDLLQRIRFQFKKKKVVMI